MPPKKDLQVTQASPECNEDVLQQEPTAVRDANMCDNQATEFEAPKDYDVNDGVERFKCIYSQIFNFKTEITSSGQVKNMNFIEHFVVEHLL